MPVIELPKFPSGSLVPGLALVYVHAVMCFPNDERRRRAFIDYSLAGKLEKLAEFRDDPRADKSRKILAHAALLYHVRQGSAGDLMRGFTKAVEVAAEGGAPKVTDRLEAFIAEGGFVAANVLLSVLYYAEHERRRASINHALDTLGEAIKVHDGQHSHIRTDRGSLRGRWTAFRPVAHLWAAYLLLGIEYEKYKKSRTKDKELESTVGEFLAMAESLRKRGELHVPPHARPTDTLLKSNETWRVSEDLRLRDVDVSIPPPKSAPAHNGPPAGAPTGRGRSGMKTGRRK